MKKYLFLSSSILLLLLVNISLFAQVTVSGPTCVVPGTLYQYAIKGSWDPTSTMQVCVKGGVISEKNNSKDCSTKGSVLGAVSVTWLTGSKGSISISSSKGNASMSVDITTNLDGGSISTDLKMQSINSGNKALDISCTAASGGSCSPAYEYQWQESSNALEWTDISGSTNQNIVFSKPVLDTKYYRRKTTETGSGTMAYSDVAMIGSIVSTPGN